MSKMKSMATVKKEAKSVAVAGTHSTNILIMSKLIIDPSLKFKTVNYSFCGYQLMAPHP